MAQGFSRDALAGGAGWLRTRVPASAVRQPGVSVVAQPCGCVEKVVNLGRGLARVEPWGWECEGLG